MSRRKRNEPYFAVLDAFGIEIVRLRQSKHLNVVGRYRDREVRCSISTSPSDWRTHLEFRKNIRHACAAIDAELGGQK